MNTTNYSTDTEYRIITKVGATTLNYQEILEEGGYLPPLPYSISLDIGNKGRTFTSIQKMVPANYNWAVHTYWDMYSNKIVINRGSLGPVTVKSRQSPNPEALSAYVPDPLASADVADALKRFDNNLLLKVKGQSLPILMALKERKATADLIGDFLDKSYKAAYSVRHPRLFFKALRGRFPNQSETRRLNNAHKRLLRKAKRQKLLGAHSKPVTIADAFLQYRFAYSPTLKDIKDMVDGVDKAMKKGTDKIVRKGISYNKSFKATTAWGWLFGDHYIDTDISIVGHQTVNYMIDDASAAAYSQMQSISATLYDNVPYSFIADGLVNISKYLECSNAVLGVRFVSGYKSVKQICIQKMTIKEPTWSGSNSITPAVKTIVTEFPSNRYQLKFTRQILTAFPEPRLEFPYKDYINLQHIADISALLVQKLKGKF